MPERNEAYARYVLGVLVLVYVLNFLDRQIVSILAERIKADLGLRDDQIGFLYGTAFAIFYAVFGIPLGRLADVWDRRKLISIGLAFWSAMTAVSGLSRNFLELAAARIGVGIGEASASPAAYSLLSDYFPAARRATVLAIYSSGIYVGVGLGLGLGGLVVDRWDQAFAEGGAPFELRGWQVAYFAVGLPGILFALWVRTLREPVRGSLEGIVTPPCPHPFREFARELRSVLPPLTILHLVLERAPRRLLAVNLLAAAAIAAGAALLSSTLGTPIQWVSLGIGLYATFSWGQSLRLRDPVAAAILFHTPTLLWGGLSFGFLGFAGYGMGFWTAPFFIRVHGVSEGEAGLVLGGTAAVAGWLGTMLGGFAADRWRRATPAGRLHLAMVTGLAPIPFLIAMLATESRWIAYVLNAPVVALSSMWIGAGASTVQDLVLPRMRATASAAFLLIVTLVGLALGPYLIGLASSLLVDLRLALLCVPLAGVVAATSAAIAGRRIVADEATLLSRARAAGEPVG